MPGKKYSAKQKKIARVAGNPNKLEAADFKKLRMSKKKKRKQMAKLCARGKAAAKRKFKVYPSAYANMYAGAVCSGKVTPGGKKKKKKKR